MDPQNPNHPVEGAFSDDQNSWQPPVPHHSFAHPEPPRPPEPVEPPQLSVPRSLSSKDDLPVPVLQVLSVRGVEYTMMTLTLWFAAGALIAMLLGVANGESSFSFLSFPLALLLVCLPIFAFFFLRLRKSELANPALRFDASKRRLSQFTQVLAFAACLFNVIAFVYMVLQKFGGESAPSIGKSLLNLLVVLAVAGGILAYYWIDEHRLTK